MPPIELNPGLIPGRRSSRSRLLVPALRLVVSLPTTGSTPLRGRVWPEAGRQAISGEGIAAIHHRHEGSDSMTTAMAKPGNTENTFLVHFFGGGLTDERYVVERFRAYADGDIRPLHGEGTAKKNGGRPRRVTATLKAVKELRPACTEIIICTGLRTRGGQQLWGIVATGLLCERRQRG